MIIDIFLHIHLCINLQKTLKKPLALFAFCWQGAFDLLAHAEIMMAFEASQAYIPKAFSAFGTQF